MNGLHFSIDLPVEKRAVVGAADASAQPPPPAGAPAERTLARASLDVPGLSPRRVEVEVSLDGDSLEVAVHAPDEAAPSVYLIPFAWLMRRVALAHLSYRPDVVRGAERSASRGD